MSSNNKTIPEIEEEILEFWKENRSFEVGNELHKDNEKYVFYDGPPFATGLPHYGHILSGTIKDTIGRYFHQKGFYVERRFGWDCHGLPVEHEIDKKLKINDRRDIYDMGIDKYNEACRGIVDKYTGEWEKVVERMGRWVDFKYGYKTMDKSFMESVWFIFKQIFDRNRVYRGYKIMPFSTACKTAMSNFEASQNYKEVSDPSILLCFPVVDKSVFGTILKDAPEFEQINFVAWTTTPWTLPANCGLCINPKFKYSIFTSGEDTSKLFIMHKDRVDSYIKNSKVAVEVEGKDLIGIDYEQPFLCYESYRERGFFKTIAADFVTADNGTAIVHCAPSFGEEDYKVFVKQGLIGKDEEPPCHVDENGKFTIELEKFFRNKHELEKTLKGFYIKDADKIILSVLKSKLLLNSRIVHSYPYCWRSDTPLVYKLVPNWHIKVDDLRDRFLETLEATSWTPNDVKTKRFKNWLANASDWAVSRGRFWGTPLPIWAKYENGKYDFNDLICIGTVKELEELTKTTVTDLHRHFVDHLTFEKDGKTYKRIEEVLDCWFESGSMPYAQDGLKDIFTSDNKVKYKLAPEDATYLKKKNFPANFIGEGIDQTRGWFYTLHVISTILFDSPAFSNVIVNGIVLAEDGKKMSKRLKNYPDVNHVFNRYGADALRLYLLSSPVVEAENLRFTEKGVEEIVKTVIIPWRNVLAFYDSLCEFENVEEKEDKLELVDWIYAELNNFTHKINSSMQSYKLNTVYNNVTAFINSLSNWFIRINRKALRGNKEVLRDLIQRFSIAMGPFTPFFAEYSYQKTTQGEKTSVHHNLIPDTEKEMFNDFDKIRIVVDGIRHLRDKFIIKLKKVLKSVTVVVGKDSFDEFDKLLDHYGPVIRKECNVLHVYLKQMDEYNVDVEIKPNFAAIDKKEIKGKLALIKEKKDEIAQMVKDGKEVTIIPMNELLVKVQFVNEESAGLFDGIGVILDTEENDESREMSLARDFMSFINKMRKNLNLKPTDAVDVAVEDEKVQEIIQKYYSGDISFDKNAEIVGQEEYAYGDIKTQVHLTKK